MEYPTVGSGDVFAIDEDDGLKIAPDENGNVTLGVDTYLFPLGGSASPLTSVHIKTDAAIAGTFTIETCNFPPYKGDGGAAPTDVTDWDTATVGNWIKEDPSTAYVATVGTGWTVTNLSLAKTAGTGGAMIHLGNLGSRRHRLKAVITTGGKVRVSRWAKA